MERWLQFFALVSNLRLILLSLFALSACDAEVGSAPDFQGAFENSSVSHDDPQGVHVPGEVASAPVQVLTEHPSDWVYRISYYSQNEVNQALVVIPRSPMPPGGFPLFVYNHGTVGLADRCAPSNTPQNSFNSYRFPTHGEERRYITILPDYDGYNNDSPHHYVTSEHAAKSVLDAIRAVKTLVPEGNDYGFDLNREKLVIGGYSQGGHVTLKTLEIQADYAPEIQFSLALGIAPGSDMLAHLQTMAEYDAQSLSAGGPGHPYFGLASIAFYAVERAETPGQERIRFMNSPNHEELPEAMDTKCVGQLNVPTSAFTDDFRQRARTRRWDDTPWGPWFAKRVAGDFTSTTPIVLISGVADNVVGPSETTALYERLKSRGNQVAHIVSPLADHASLPVAADKLIGAAVNLPFFNPELSPTAVYDLSSFTYQEHVFQYQSN